jgi:hypothetical protein
MKMDKNGGTEMIEKMNFCEKATWDGVAGWGRVPYTMSPLFWFIDNILIYTDYTRSITYYIKINYSHVY